MIRTAAGGDAVVAEIPVPGGSGNGHVGEPDPQRSRAGGGLGHEIGHRLGISQLQFPNRVMISMGFGNQPECFRIVDNGNCGIQAIPYDCSSSKRMLADKNNVGVPSIQGGIIYICFEYFTDNVGLYIRSW